MNTSKSETLKAKIGLTGTGLNRIAGAPPLIPDHQMLRCIGQGSYGEVWLARNAVGTWRAIKVVYRQTFKDPRPYEREFAGIQSYEPISRSNEGLVDVLQIGRNDSEGYFYYVMELADSAHAGSGAQRAGTDKPRPPTGHQPPASSEFDPEQYVPKTLSRVLQQRGRLSYEECLTLGLTLNLALGHLHRNDLIHRDVKPSNIIFVNGVPKLADIGLVTDLAEAQSFVGTEGFIPPEGPNSSQADLYALGKVLYEASMGKDRNEFPEPLTGLGLDLNSRLLMELNAVLVRACAPDPKERYKRAEQMNADLALLHNGESVRNKHAVARRLRLMTRVGAAAMAVLILAVIPYSLALREAHNAEISAALAKTEAANSREVAQFLKQTLKGAEPSVALGRDTSMLREILDRTAKLLDRSLTSQPEVEAELRGTLGQVYQEVGDYIAAERMLRRAVQLCGGARPAEQNATLAQYLSDLSMALAVQGKAQQAEHFQRQALAIRTALPDRNELVIADSDYCLGVIFAGGNKLSEAERMFRESLAIRERVLGRGHLRIAESMNGLANTLIAQGHWPAAESMLRESLEINRKLMGERHPSYLWILNNLVQALLAQDKLKEAEALARQGLALQKEILGADHPLLAISMTRLARVLEEEGRTSEAKTNLDQALLIWRKRLSNQDPSMGETVSALMDILLSKCDYSQAKEVFDQVSAPQALANPNKTVLFACGNYLARTGNFKSAAEHFQKVIQLDSGNHEAYQALAALYFQLGDLQAYRQFCNQILASFGTVTNDPRIADRMAKSCLISPPTDPKDFAAVTNLAQIAVTFDANAANNPWFQFCKGFAEYRAGNFAGARVWMRKVLERVRDGSTRDVGAYMILAMAEQGLQKPEAARDAFDKGTKLAATRLRSLARGDIESGWTDWILAHALIREAEKVTGREAEETTAPVTVAAP